MRNIFFIIALITVAACGAPKEVAIKTPTKKAPTKAAKAGCATFDNTPDANEAMKIHVLAHDYVKAQDYENALPLWEKSYKMAPAANGQTAVVYKDGIKIYTSLYNSATAAAKKKMYKNKVIELYDARVNCFPDDENEVLSQKIRDLYYNFKDKSDILTLGERALEVGGMDASSAIFYAYADVAATAFIDKKITKDEALDIYNKLNIVAVHNMNDDDDPEKAERYTEAWGHARDRYEHIGAQVFDCQRYVDKYKGDFDANPTKETARALVPKLSVKGCDESNAFFAQVWKTAYPPVVRTVKKPTTTTTTNSGSSVSDMSSAEKVAYYEGKLDDPSISDSKKFDYALYAAKVAYSKLGQKSKGRSLARQAAQFNPSSGEPYLVIGKIYAGSGKDCSNGVGTGFDAQQVVWVAIDQWKRAISTEPGSETASAAQKLISQYTQYMPSQEDGFMKGLKEGDSFTVVCWINESTKVRF